MKKHVLVVTAVLAVMVSVVFGNDGAGVEWVVVKNSPFGGGRVNSIAWGKDKFVAVGDGGKMAYSLDGVTWTVVKNSTFNNAINAIAWGKDKFVAGNVYYPCEECVYGQIAYSSDGINWKKASDDNRISDIVWGNDKFLGSHSDGNGGYGIVYSSDGITWINSSFYCNGGTISFSWGNNKFVAVGGGCGGDSYNGEDDYNFAYSSDGITWTGTGKIPFVESSTSAIAWGNGVFVAGSYDGQIVYSSDGITWKNKYPSTPRKQNLNRKIIYVENGRVDMNAPVTNSPFGNAIIHSIVWGNDKFVAGGGKWEDKYRNGKMMYSLDGKTWTLVENYPFGKSPTTVIAYGNGVFVAGSGDGQIAYSK